MGNRQPRKLSPLASAVRIAPLAAFAGAASAATIPVTNSGGFSTSDSCTIVDAVNSLNMGSLQAACAIAGTDSFGKNDTVDLTGFSDPTTITFANVASDTALNLVVKATIRGGLDNDGQPLVTLSRAANSAPARLIGTTSALTVDGLALTGGSVPGKSGGAILTGNAIAALTLTHAVVTGNAARVGGGIASYFTTTISNSIVAGNYALFQGGGISCRTPCGSLHISDSTVAGNYAAQARGGGIYSLGNTLVTGTLITGNFAGSSGGGVATNVMQLLNGSVVSGNIAQSDGGGLFGTKTTVQRSTIENNDAGGRGGGISGFGSPALYMTYSTVTGNRAQGNGGGVYEFYASIGNSTFSANTTQGNGGGIGGTFVYADNSTISGNSTRGYGAGIDVLYRTSLTATTIAGNRVVGSVNTGGAGVFVANAMATMSGTLIFGNTGGLDVDGGAGVSGDHDLVGTSGPFISLPGDTLHCDPHLAPLADNGGPTQTQALPLGSCAIDAGPAPGAAQNDQRGVGFARTTGAASDIGAFEEQFVDEIFKDGFESP